MIRKLIAKKRSHYSPAKMIALLALIVFVAALVVLLIGMGWSPSRLTGSIGLALVIGVIAAPLVYWLVLQPMNKDVENLLQGPIIDEDTRTLNERGITITLLELMAMAERYGNELSVALLKIDDANSVESKHGATGKNRFMGMSADIIADALRMPDRLGRYSGDTFMLILPETIADNASMVANRVGDSIKSHAIELEDGSTVTVSSIKSGVTQYRKGEDLASITTRVEQSLAQAV